MSQARLDGVEERLTDTGREAGHHPFDDAADAVPTLAGLLDLRDHAVCGLQVRAPDRRALDVRLDLFPRDGIRGDPSNLSGMSEELDALRLQDLARDRAGDHERGGHAAGQLAPSAEVRLASVLPDGGEVAVPARSPSANSTRSSSFRWEVRRLWPGRRRSSCACTDRGSIGVPARSPSIVQPTKGPWLVPKIVVRYREPKVFIRPPHGGPRAPACRPGTTDTKPGSTTGPRGRAARPPRGRPPRRPSASGGPRACR